MALLADAIRSSDTQAAIYRAPQGYSVIVERVTGREGPDAQEEYDVLVDHGDPRGSWRIGALNLIEALERMRVLGLPGFDPDNVQWQPTTLFWPGAASQPRHA